MTDKEFYFSRVQTEEDYNMLQDTGMYWELFPEGYETWEEHEAAAEDYWNDM